MTRRTQVLTEERRTRERKKGTQVLVEHHEALRGMMRRLLETRRTEPGRRRALVDELHGELRMHERIEEEIFYPSVQDVTPVIAAAWSEHRQLSDQLAALLCADPRSDRFDDEMHVMHDALESHAHLDEEQRMFPEVEQFMDEEQLVDLGERLQAHLERLRSSKARRLRHRLERMAIRRRWS
jgi:hemerythrin superfamily protein